MNVAWNCSFSLSASGLNVKFALKGHHTVDGFLHEIISAFLRRVADDECEKFQERAADDW
jgi:hypothetical protein